MSVIDWANPYASDEDKGLGTLHTGWVEEVYVQNDSPYTLGIELKTSCGGRRPRRPTPYSVRSECAHGEYVTWLIRAAAERAVQAAVKKSGGQRVEVGGCFIFRDPSHISYQLPNGRSVQDAEQRRLVRLARLAKTADQLTASGDTQIGESAAEWAFAAAYLEMKPAPLNGLVNQHWAGSYRLDFALPAKLIGIEVDGYAYHSSRDAFHDDRVRWRTLQGLGWQLIHFSGREVCGAPGKCVLETAELVTKIFPRAARFEHGQYR